jgi:hypothetical protein
MLHHSIVSQHFIEPEGSIPNSQELSTFSYPEPDQSSPHHSIPPLQDPSKYYPPIYVLVSPTLYYQLPDQAFYSVPSILGYFSVLSFFFSYWSIQLPRNVSVPYM